MICQHPVTFPGHAAVVGASEALFTAAVGKTNMRSNNVATAEPQPQLETDLFEMQFPEQQRHENNEKHKMSKDIILDCEQRQQQQTRTTTASTIAANVDGGGGDVKHNHQTNNRYNYEHIDFDESNNHNPGNNARKTATSKQQDAASMQQQ